MRINFIFHVQTSVELKAESGSGKIEESKINRTSLQFIHSHSSIVVAVIAAYFSMNSQFMRANECPYFRIPCELGHRTGIHARRLNTLAYTLHSELARTCDCLYYANPLELFERQQRGENVRHGHLGCSRKKCCEGVIQVHQRWIFFYGESHFQRHLMCIVLTKLSIKMDFLTPETLPVQNLSKIKG